MIVDLNEERRKKKELQDDYDYLCRWRASLEQAVTIDSHYLTEIDAWLSDHPLLEPEMNLRIKSRAMRVLWLEYGDASAERKREILLTLREEYRALPTHIQEELWKELYRWLDEFEEKEVRCGERAESERRYVWTYEVREMSL